MACLLHQVRFISQYVEHTETVFLPADAERHGDGVVGRALAGRPGRLGICTGGI